MLGVGGVDSAGERLGDSFEHFAAEAARDERCEAFVAMAAAARNQGSIIMRSLPSGESSGLRSIGSIGVGASSEKPSGISASAPLRTT